MLISAVEIVRLRFNVWKVEAGFMQHRDWVSNFHGGLWAEVVLGRQDI